MKKRIISFFGVLVLLIQGATSVTYASLCPGTEPGSSGTNYGAFCDIFPQSGFGGIAMGVISLFILLAVIGSLFFLIWGGVRWILSGGDKGKIDQARSTIIAGVIGLAIALLSFGIVNLLLFIFTNRDLSGGFNIPKLVR